MIVNRRIALTLACLSLVLTAPPSIAASDGDSGRSVSVTGQGEVLAQPDRAFVTLGVEARDPEIDAARAAVNRTVEQVLNLVRDLGIDPDQVDASRISIRPEYDWNPEQRERRFLGYYVARQVEVDVRDLDQLGRLLERAVDLGVNQVGDPRLDSSRRRELEREALALAVEDARSNAEVIARAAAVALGPVRRVAANTAVIAPPPRYAMMEARMANDGGAADTYVTGEMKFTATVQAEYDLVVSTR